MRAILGKLNNELLYNLALEAAPYCAQVDAAVAYADDGERGLLHVCKERGLRLTFYGLLDEGGAVSNVLLRELLALGPSLAEAHMVRGYFHAKVIWWRGFGAYVGSANLTDRAWFNNVEAGIFLEEKELLASDVGAELDAMFDYLAENSFPVSDELVDKLERLEDFSRPSDSQRRKNREQFDQLFAHVPEHRGLITPRPKGTTASRRLAQFATEWAQTLQLMRGLGKEFNVLRLRPTWVDAAAHPTAHFDQFLHAFYYSYVRGVSSADEDDELTGRERVEAFFLKNKANPAAGLLEAARWWASLKEAPYGEDVFIRETAPAMRERLSRKALAHMDRLAFREAMRYVNAFRMHARQVKKSEFGLSADQHESIEACVDRLCDKLWEERTPTGKTVQDVFEFVLWGSSPTDMERRLWQGVWSDDYRLDHVGRSMLGEAVGWARPDDYPPRNNRTNKALRSLGHDVKLFSD